MGFAAAVDLGAAAPAFVTLGTSATCTKKTYRKEGVWVRAMGTAGAHGQSKMKRVKHIVRAEGNGSITANTTEAGTSEATAIIDSIRDGQRNEDFDTWSVEGHWFADS